MVKFLGLFCLIGSVFSAPSITDSLTQTRSDYQNQHQDGQVETIQYETQTVEIGQPIVSTVETNSATLQSVGIQSSTNQAPLKIQSSGPCFAGIPRNNYMFKLYNDLLPAIPFTLTDNGFSFSGCNDQKITLQAGADKSVQFLGRTTSTFKSCPSDNDQNYIDAIGLADAYGVDANGQNFFLSRKGFRFIDFIKIVAPAPQLILTNPPSRNIRNQPETQAPHRQPSQPPQPPHPPKQNCFSPELAFTSTGPDYRDQGSVNTKFGLVRIVSINKPRPAGWRILQYYQGKQIKSQLSSIMQEWSIVAFNCNGKLDGRGYGNKFIDTRGPECGQVFIVRQ